MSGQRTAGSQVAKREAVAAVRALLEGREEDAELLICDAEHPRALALMASGLAASVIRQSGMDGSKILEHLIWASAAQD